MSHDTLKIDQMMSVLRFLVLSSLQITAVDGIATELHLRNSSDRNNLRERFSVDRSLREKVYVHRSTNVINSLFYLKNLLLMALIPQKLS